MQDASNEREFKRIETTLPIKISLVPPEEIPRLKDRAAKDSAFQYKKLYPLDNEPLGEWLAAVDAKLDLILQLLFENQKVFDMPLQVCDISAGGMKIVLQEKFSPGDILDIKMVYPSPNPQILHLYGEVLRSEQRDNGYITAFKFIHMDDSLCDKIVKLVFEKEREMIREKRGQ